MRLKKNVKHPSKCTFTKIHTCLSVNIWSVGIFQNNNISIEIVPFKLTNFQKFARVSPPTFYRNLLQTITHDKIHTFLTWTFFFKKRTKTHTNHYKVTTISIINLTNKSYNSPILPEDPLVTKYTIMDYDPSPRNTRYNKKKATLTLNISKNTYEFKIYDIKSIIN